MYFSGNSSINKVHMIQFFLHNSTTGFVSWWWIHLTYDQTTVSPRNLLWPLLNFQKQWLAHHLPLIHAMLRYRFRCPCACLYFDYLPRATALAPALSCSKDHLVRDNRQSILLPRQYGCRCLSQTKLNVLTAFVL